MKRTWNVWNSKYDGVVPNALLALANDDAAIAAALAVAVAAVDGMRRGPSAQQDYGVYGEWMVGMVLLAIQPEISGPWKKWPTRMMRLVVNWAVSWKSYVATLALYLSAMPLNEIDSSLSDWIDWRNSD